MRHGCSGEHVLLDELGVDIALDELLPFQQIQVELNRGGNAVTAHSFRARFIRVIALLRSRPQTIT